MASDEQSPPRAAARVLALPRPYAWSRLIRGTVATCFRYRVTGLAAEAGFFSLLSLPPLVLGLFGAFGYLTPFVSPDVIQAARQQIVELAELALTAESVRQVIVPTLDDVLTQGRADIISLGFLLSLWSGSRAVNVYVDTISIMYGLGGRRGIIHQRMLSFALYVLALLLGVVLLPLILAGPTLVDQWLPPRLDWMNSLYWPLVVVLFVGWLATAYKISVPAKTRWLRAVPGALLALGLCLLLSYLLRELIAFSVGGSSIYGPLAAPIVVLLWLYLISIAVLIGAALNASADRIWPAATTAKAREDDEHHPEFADRIDPEITSEVGTPEKGGPEANRPEVSRD